HILGLHSRQLHSIPPRRSSDLVSIFLVIPKSDMIDRPSAISVSNRRMRIPFVKHHHLSTKLGPAGLFRRVEIREPRFLHGIVILDRKSTRLNSSHVKISYAVFC